MEAGDPFAARPLDDFVFELIEHRLQPVQMGEIRVDEGIEDRVREEIRSGLQHHGILLAQPDADILVRWKHVVVDRDDELLGDEEGELIRIDFFGPDNRAGHDEHDVVVHVDLRRELPTLGILECERVATK